MKAASTRLKQHGFTIVETMIVLAVTGMLFVIAAIAVSGEQNHAEFQQAITNVQSGIQQAIDQVASGEYPNLGNLTCGASGGGLMIPDPSQPNQQGTNTGCVFLGKALQFSFNNNAQQYATYPIAGLQCIGGTIANSGGIACDGTLPQTDPAAIATTNGSPHPSFPNKFGTTTLQYGLSVLPNSMVYTDTSGTQQHIGAVAFVSSQGAYNGSDLESGSQDINLYPIDRSALGTGSAQAAAAIDNYLNGSPTPNPTGGVQVCFVSGNTDQSGMITIGSNGSNLSVTLAIKSNRTCS